MLSKELQELGAKWLDAGYAYWTAAQKEDIGGAIVWIADLNGYTCVFTRGEYRQTLMNNIDRIGPTRYFGAMKDDWHGK